MAKKKTHKKKKKNNQVKAAPPKPSYLPWIITAVVVIAILAIIFWPKSTKTSQIESTKGDSFTESVEPTLSDKDPEPPVYITNEEAQQAARDNLESGMNYFADIDIEGYGVITVQLAPEVAPITVHNFVQLAEEGFYDGLTFHRIIDTFMMQGGDPLGNGTGGSDMEIQGEFSMNGFTNDISHTRGVISMARSSDPNSASSQFFIVHQDSQFLDGQYAAFGCVTEGMEIVDAVCTEAMPIDNNGTIPAGQQPIINTITIRTEPA